MQRIEKIAQTVKNETEKLIISHKLDKTGITADDIVYKTNGLILLKWARCTNNCTS